MNSEEPQMVFGKRRETADGSVDPYSPQVMASAETRVRLMTRYLDESLPPGGPRLKVLDVGCADGGLFKSFAGRCELFGVDISESWLEQATRNGYTAFLVDVSHEALPFEDGSMDIVIAGEVIEHIVNTDWLMSEVNRVLKDDGKLIISIPNINQWISVPMMLFFDLPPRYSARFRAPHVRDFTFRTMKICLREFGFSIIKREGTGLFVPHFFKNVLVSLTRWIPRLATEIVFLCRKTSRVAYDESKSVVIDCII
jgi:SAM-dependent methyltransferase